jgi:hypothetical protein
VGDGFAPAVLAIAFGTVAFMLRTEPSCAVSALRVSIDYRGRRAMTRKTELQAAVDRVDHILSNTSDVHSLITVRRQDALVLLLAANLDIEVATLREKLSVALAGGAQHRSDCSVYNAPAYEPTSCDCGAAA